MKAFPSKRECSWWGGEWWRAAMPSSSETMELPPEVWCLVLQWVAGETLYRCGQVCRAWRHETRRLGGAGRRQTYLVCPRLDPGPGLQDHRRAGEDQ